MARDHKLDFSGHKPSAISTFRPERNRSRSPKRPRSDSWRPGISIEDASARHDGRRSRGKAKTRTENGYRDRSPDQFRDTIPQGTHTRSRKRKKGQNGAGSKGLSDKIHSLRRLLEKAVDMPAEERQAKERELQGYVTDQQACQAKREKNAVTSRYHFVRFLERKKADRRLKQLERAFDRVMTVTETTTDARNEMHEDGAENMKYGADGHQVLSSAEKLALQQEDYKRRLHEAKVDLNYTLYAPLDQKYISLYPSATKEGRSQQQEDQRQAGKHHDDSIKDDEAGLLRNDSGQKPPLWYEVEKAMENDNLHALRDGKVLKAGNDGDHSLTYRSMLKPAGRTVVPGTGPASAGEDKHEDEDSEEDFFER